jgi:hypothetical protein
MSSDLITLLPTAYFPPVSYFVHMVHSRSVLIEQMETYPKQTYRNRCEIITSAGALNLIIPVTKPNGNHTITRDIGITYREPWNHHHWKSIQTAYRSSPYFNYYADILEPFFMLKEPSLIGLNNKILNTINRIISIKPEITFTLDYLKQPEGRVDLRSKMTPKKQQMKMKYPEYPQVFSHIHGFKENLSVLDLIFNLGPEAKEYIMRIADRQPLTADR